MGDGNLLAGNRIQAQELFRMIELKVVKAGQHGGRTSGSRVVRDVFDALPTEPHLTIASKPVKIVFPGSCAHLPVSPRTWLVA